MRVIPLIAILAFTGYKIAGRPGAMVSIAMGLFITIGMAIAPAAGAKAEVAEWGLIGGVAAMIACDWLPGRRRRR